MLEASVNCHVSPNETHLMQSTIDICRKPGLNEQLQVQRSVIFENYNQLKLYYGALHLRVVVS
jgi:hypothetical protein